VVSRHARKFGNKLFRKKTGCLLRPGRRAERTVYRVKDKVESCLGKLGAFGGFPYNCQRKKAGSRNPSVIF
jgi:hypothetical protein